ncbi:MAG: hypothetical protein QOE33_1039 [Acidobacteriota bacterium]|nr:hypothetical protein [Acidobacteriota bacterium]
MIDMMPTPDTPTFAHALPIFAGDSTHDEPGGGDTLDDAAREEKEYVRTRLRDELGRDPTDAEIDEWLRDHTEGY